MRRWERRIEGQLVAAVVVGGLEIEAEAAVGRDGQEGADLEAGMEFAAVVD